VLEERDVPTVVFNPAFGADQVTWRPTGTVLTSPVPNNPSALRDPTVYLIFAGPSWNSNNTYPLASAAGTIINSSYLSGLTQYGSDGRATFGGYAIDNSVRAPARDFEAEIRAIVPTQSTWAQPSARGYTSSPVYVVVYDTGGEVGYNEAYQWTPYGGRPTYYNSILVNDQGNGQNNFTDLFSHELAERISDGAANGIGVSAPGPLDGTQIGDGEPDGARYTATLGGTNIVVQAYWSLAQQAFIVPDGNAQTLVLDPIWQGPSYTGYAFTLIRGQLYEVSTAAGSNYNNLLASGQGPSAPSDTDVAACVMDPTAGAGASIYDLNASGQVREYSVASGTWVPVSPTGLTATSIASVNHQLYVLAGAAGGPAQVWQYANSGTLWYDITPPGFTITRMAAAPSEVNGLYILAGQNGGPAEVWMYGNSGTLWWRLTGLQTTILQLVATPDALYILGDNGGPAQVWLYGNSGTNWTPVTATTTSIDSITSAYGELLVLASNNGGPAEVWQYNGPSAGWILLGAG
jgi:hypothetical protein